MADWTDNIVLPFDPIVKRIVTGHGMHPWDFTRELFGAKTPQQKRDIAAAGRGADERAAPELTPGELAANIALRNTLQGRVAGTAPSPAELQMRAGLDRQLAGINAAAASGSGASNPGLALRQALFAGQNAGSAFNQDAAILRAQEQAAAEGRLASLLGMNQGAALNSRGLNDARSWFDHARADKQASDDAAATAAVTGTVLNIGGALVGGPAGSAIGSALKGDSPGSGVHYGSGPITFDTGAPYEPMVPNNGPYSAGPVYVPPNDYYNLSARSTGGNPISGYSPMADGDILTKPTKILAGESGPEAVVPLTSPADAALAAQMIERARAKKRIEAMAAMIQALGLGGAQAGAR